MDASFDRLASSTLNLCKWLLFVLSAILLVSSPSRADYKAGVQAWESGNCRLAIAEWMAAANAEDNRAMLALGRAHLQGLGVLQDSVEAHKWFNLAASYGIPEAVKERDALDARITAEQRMEAQSLARKWQPGATASDVRAFTEVESQIRLDDPNLPLLPKAEILEPSGLIVMPDIVTSPSTNVQTEEADLNGIRRSGQKQSASKPFTPCGRFEQSQ